MPGRIVKERAPRVIGINESDVIWAADGLSASLKRKLTETVGDRFRPRFQSAEKPATLWLERFWDRIYVSTYSPALGKFDRSDPNEFTLEYAMSSTGSK